MICVAIQIDILIRQRRRHSRDHTQCMVEAMVSIARKKPESTFAIKHNLDKEEEQDDLSLLLDIQDLPSFKGLSGPHKLSVSFGDDFYWYFHGKNCRRHLRTDFAILFSSFNLYFLLFLSETKKKRGEGTREDSGGSFFLFPPLQEGWRRKKMWWLIASAVSLPVALWIAAIYGLLPFGLLVTFISFFHPTPVTSRSCFFLLC